jgi:heat shock protein 4
VTPEQVLAFFMKKLKEFYIASGISSNEFVFSVPSYFSNVERQGVYDASEIAGIKCIRLINESTAVALSYGFFRKMDLPEKDPRYVVFLDLGHGKLTITFASFIKSKLKIIIHQSDRNLGARNFDLLLLEKLGEAFTKKFGCDPRKNPRSRLRMLDAIEKQRKILSANLHASVYLESLLEDEDMNENIDRKSFEEMITPQVDRIRALLIDTLEKSGKSPRTILFAD